ncbi:PfkB family carbohydrate kinase [Streptomyces sp. MJP52]|uniref:PfkB family carbohydrate kinase n=1 Tax=Streptomyces sp. MJP52 TaxID=2940555 RepID=UPI002474A9CE|nr:PfkB family carbohydrate kinase [Streptomyces sp. MJP52]MDH6226361.1 tagatose 6-phosphate kinase [Streptomyces sp. MJP52]
MILTVTLNAALDTACRAREPRPRTGHRVPEVVERPGGKGIGVARALAALGHRVTVTGFAGGPTGRTARELLARAPGPPVDALIPVGATARRAGPAAGPAAAGTALPDEPGPAVTAADWAALQAVYRDLLPTARAVALCGGLPPGVPVGAYAQLVREARAAGVPVLLDTSGEPLRRGVAARPDLLTSHAGELAELTGSHDPLRAALDARRRGARTVVASLGAGGLLAVGPEGHWAVGPEGHWRAAPPRPPHEDPAGAGDSVAAGLLSGLAEDLPWPGRLARAAALSAATAAASAAGGFDRPLYEELLGRVRVAEAAPAG